MIRSTFDFNLSATGGAPPNFGPPAETGENSRTRVVMG
tara:strand:+ start:267 stop:380 length:114 start_codon:yes stop_codon:yes gene_type:complete